MNRIVLLLITNLIIASASYAQEAAVLQALQNYLSQNGITIGGQGTEETARITAEASRNRNTYNDCVEDDDNDHEDCKHHLEAYIPVIWPRYPND